MSLMTTSSAFSATLLPFPPPPRLSVARLRLHPRRRALVRCAAVSEIAPAASAAYGVLLLGGGAFAYARSGSKGSIYGGLAGAALMGA
ncbi:hypothetical protein SORBI_3006G187800 [Sorghum bicolor]|nr:hypothetical protein SORBI_3006G187800 [Sorghum bicolor]